MNEIWKEIEGFKDYEISNLGRVKSLKYNKERILKAVINTDSYLTVCLSKKNKTIHQLMAIAFLSHKP